MDRRDGNDADIPCIDMTVDPRHLRMQCTSRGWSTRLEARLVGPCYRLRTFPRMILPASFGGLEVKTNEGWIDAPPNNGSFICNIGDMLDRMTRGVYRSTPHRVRNSSGKNRLSFPFFFDPKFHARVQPIELPNGERENDDQQRRWDKTSVHTFSGTYGDYLLNKIGRVFPGLKSEVL